MANFFDQYDTATPTKSGNYFDQFDAPKTDTGLPPVSPVTGKPYIMIGPKGSDVESKSKPSGAESFGRGAMAGATLNFADEIEGLSKASGIPAENFLNVPIGAVRLLYEAIAGKGDATKRYEAARDEIRRSQKEAQEENPGSYLGGNVLGSVAVPIPGMAALSAATVPARMVRGGIAGAGVGAVSGAGEGEDIADRATKAAAGGALGGIVGAVAPPLVEGVIQGGRAVAAPLVSGVRGAFRPADEASRRVATQIERDLRADPGAVGRLTPQEFAAARAEGAPARVMDLGGETTRALARSAANTSPEGRGALTRSIDDTFEGQSGRLSDWLRQTFHYPDAAAQQTAIEQTARAVNRGAYARAYRDGDRQIWSPELERLTSSPDVVAAMRDAATKGKSRAVRDGLGGFNPGVTVENGIVTFQRGPNGVPTYPNLQFWDYTKRALDDAANAARRQGRDSEAGVLGDLARGLRGELDRVVPSYGQARAGAASFFGAENALEAGQAFVGASQRFGIPAARAAIARMTPQERQLFQDGYVSRFVEAIERSPDRRNVLNKIGQSAPARQELIIALGPRRAAELEARLRVEGIRDLARGAVQGNSNTARQLAEIGLAGGAGGVGAYGTYNLDPSQMTAAAVAGAIMLGKRNIDQRVAQRVAQMLVSDNPAVITRGIQLVARNNRVMEALRAADLRIARIGGEQAPGIAPKAAGVAGAEESEPGVPRPRGQ